MTDRQALLLLNSLPGFDYSVYCSIISRWEGPAAFWEAEEKQLEGFGAKGSFLRDFEELRRLKPDSEDERECSKRGFAVVTITDRDYPLCLRNIPSPPLVMYLWGEPLPRDDRNAIAVVGRRKPTAYGVRAARMLTRDLVAGGFIVVSGLARGIDSVSHREALRGGGKTIAVLGSALDRIYPGENFFLAKAISRRGTVVSEFPLGTAPLPFNFPRRNRIISGLAAGTVVVEAGEKSGALITADRALEQGKEVFAVPGEIDSPASVGTHRLIKEGAKITCSAGDIMEEFCANTVAETRQENIT